jgi:hypothetical protein
MGWVYLVGLAPAIWAGRGAVIAIGRRLWSIDTTLRVAAAHGELAPQFNPLLRAAAMTIIVMLLDALVVAPLFEGSYTMFKSVIGTWLPFVAIFAAAWAAGVVAL